LPEFTSEQLLSGISAAVEAHDWDAVAALLRRLAVVDPHQAQGVLDLITAATAVTEK
jgi:hypothetical protein